TYASTKLGIDPERTLRDLLAATAVPWHPTKTMEGAHVLQEPAFFGPEPATQFVVLGIMLSDEVERGGREAAHCVHDVASTPDRGHARDGEERLEQPPGGLLTPPLSISESLSSSREKVEKHRPNQPDDRADRAGQTG